MGKTTNILDLNNRLTKVEKENVAQNSYTSLKNKPKINNVTLTGNKSLEDIGAAAAADLGVLIVVSRVTASSAIEVPANKTNKFTIPATKSGYKPIGVVGWGASSGTSDIFIVEVLIDDSDNINGFLRNIGSSQASVLGLQFDVLYAKDV